MDIQIFAVINLIGSSPVRLVTAEGDRLTAVIWYHKLQVEYKKKMTVEKLFLQKAIH